MKKNKKSELEINIENLEERFARWEKLYNEGGSDPFWHDGFNLNLVRNHILYHKRKIEEEINSQNEGQTSFLTNTFPDIYYKETPPEVDNNYMAVPNRILDTAINFYNRLKEEPSFKYIIEHYDEVFPDRKEDLVTKKYNVPLIPASWLRRYEELLKSGNILEIRRIFFFTDYDDKVKQLENIAEKMKQVLALSPEEKEAILNKKKNKNIEVDDEDFVYTDEDTISDEDLVCTFVEEKSNSKGSLDKMIDNVEQRQSFINTDNVKGQYKDTMERV